jgi:hypothetical protein
LRSAVNFFTPVALFWLVRQDKPKHRALSHLGLLLIIKHRKKFWKCPYMTSKNCRHKITNPSTTTIVCGRPLKQVHAELRWNKTFLVMVWVEGADELALVLRVAGVVIKKLPSHQIDEEQNMNHENGTA